MSPPNVRLTDRDPSQDLCSNCEGSLIVISVTQVGDPHDSWLVYCNDCGLEEAREDLGVAYGAD